MQHINKTTYILFSIILTFALSSCQQSSKKSQSLYQQIGGGPVINSLTVALVDRLYKNEKIGFLFEASDFNREEFIKHISDQICLETGGNCAYEGRDMVESHSGLDIKLSEFDIFVQEFIAAMEDVNIPFTQQNKILALFSVMRDEVVKQ